MYGSPIRFSAQPGQMGTYVMLDRRAQHGMAPQRHFRGNHHQICGSSNYQPLHHPFGIRPNVQVHVNGRDVSRTMSTPFGTSVTQGRRPVRHVQRVHSEPVPRDKVPQPTQKPVAPGGKESAQVSLLIEPTTTTPHEHTISVNASAVLKELDTCCDTFDIKVYDALKPRFKLLPKHEQKYICDTLYEKALAAKDERPFKLVYYFLCEFSSTSQLETIQNARHRFTQAVIDRDTATIRRLLCINFKSVKKNWLPSVKREVFDHLFSIFPELHQSGRQDEVSKIAAQTKKLHPKSYTVTINNRLEEALNHQNIQDTQFWLEFGADLNAKPRYFRNLLQLGMSKSPAIQHEITAYCSTEKVSSTTKRELRKLQHKEQPRTRKTKPTSDKAEEKQALLQRNPMAKRASRTTTTDSSIPNYMKQTTSSIQKRK